MSDFAYDEIVPKGLFTMKHNQQLGQIGEKIAIRYLEQNNFKIIEKNFYTKWGEIDIIAEKNNRLHFIEVKTRLNINHGHPEEAVTWRKYQRSKRAVIIYLNKYKLKTVIYQIDVISILYNYKKNKAIIRYLPNINIY